MIIQVGDNINIGNDNPLAREILKTFIFDWKTRNPNLKLVGAFLHADEGTIHAHLDYIPVASGYTRGMYIQNGLDRALRQQGFNGKTASLTPQILWEKRENAYLEQLCVEKGFEVIHPERKKQKEQKRTHQAVEEYKTEKIADEIDRNYVYNQKLQKENEKLKKEIKDKEDELVKLKEKAELEIKTAKRELNTIKRKILDEKQLANFDIKNKNIFGKVKETKTLSISEYNSLVKTANRVKNVDKKEKTLNERDERFEGECNTIKKELSNKQYQLSKKEENLKQREHTLCENEEKVKRGFIYNTDKRLKAVETELKELKKHCEGVKYKNGHSVLDDFVEKQELEKNNERDYGSFSR